MSSMLDHPLAFGMAVLVVVVWAITRPIFHFSDTWQLVINTDITIITLLMAFIIQNSQNRDSEAVQLKLDELIRAIRYESLNKLPHFSQRLWLAPEKTIICNIALSSNVF